MNKRIKFLISTIVLTFGFFLISVYAQQYRFWYIGGLTLLTVLFFIWSLFEGLRLNATLLVLILPAFFTFGVGMFWFLLPASVYVTLPVIILFGIGVYALSLTSNIYVVSALRTIALFRAAKGVGFVLTLFTSFLLFDAILSVRLPIYLNVFFVAVVSFPLLLQGLWSTRLTSDLPVKVLKYTAIFTYATAVLSAPLYFWPVSVVVGSLSLTVIVYVLLGLGQARLDGRLFVQTVKEYAIVGIVVFLAMFLTTNWRG